MKKQTSRLLLWILIIVLGLYFMLGANGLKQKFIEIKESINNFLNDNETVEEPNEEEDTINLRLTQAENLILELQAQIDAINTANEVAELQEEVTTLQTANATINSNISNLVLTINGLSETVDNRIPAGTVATLQARLGDLESANTNTASTIQTLQASLNGLSETNTEIQGNIQTLQASLNGLSETNTEIQGNIQTLQANINSLQNDTTINSAITEIQGNIQTLQTNSATYNQKITTLTSNYSSLSTQVTNLASNYTSLSNNVTNLQGDYSTLSGNYATLVSRVNNLNSNYLTLNNNYNSLVNNYSTLSNQYSTLSNQMQYFNDQAQTIEYLNNRIQQLSQIIENISNIQTEYEVNCMFNRFDNYLGDETSIMMFDDDFVNKYDIDTTKLTFQYYDYYDSIGVLKENLTYEMYDESKTDKIHEIDKVLNNRSDLLLDVLYSEFVPVLINVDNMFPNETKLHVLLYGISGILRLYQFDEPSYNCFTINSNGTATFNYSVLNIDHSDPNYGLTMTFEPEQQAVTPVNHNVTCNIDTDSVENFEFRFIAFDSSFVDQYNIDLNAINFRLDGQYLDEEYDTLEDNFNNELANILQHQEDLLLNSMVYGHETTNLTVNGNIYSIMVIREIGSSKVGGTFIGSVEINSDGTLQITYTVEYGTNIAFTPTLNNDSVSI